MVARTRTAERIVSFLLLFQLGLILFMLPVGKVHTMAGRIPLSMGGNIYKNFPWLAITAAGLFLLTRQRIKWGVFIAPLAALAAVSLLSAASSLHPYGSIREGTRVLFCVVFYVVLLNIPWDRKWFRRATACFAAGVWVLAIRAAVAWATGHESRVGEFHGHPNVLGAFGVLLLPMFLFPASLPLPRNWKAFFHATAGLLLAVIILTFSRGAYLALLSALLFLAVAGSSRVRRGLVPTAVLLTIALLLAWKPIRSRWRETSLDLAAARPESRLAIWDRTFAYGLPDLPLTGWGIDKGFTEAVEAKEQSLRDRLPPPRLAHPHNQVLDILAGTGLPGLFAWSWLAAALLLHLRRPAEPPAGDLPVFLAASGVGLAVVSLFDAILISRNILPTIVLLLALPELAPQVLGFLGDQTRIPRESTAAISPGDSPPAA